MRTLDAPSDGAIRVMAPAWDDAFAAIGEWSSAQGLCPTLWARAALADQKSLMQHGATPRMYCKVHGLDRAHAMMLEGPLRMRHRWASDVERLDAMRHLTGSWREALRMSPSGIHPVLRYSLWCKEDGEAAGRYRGAALLFGILDRHALISSGLLDRSELDLLTVELAKRLGAAFVD